MDRNKIFAGPSPLPLEILLEIVTWHPLAFIAIFRRSGNRELYQYYRDKTACREWPPTFGLTAKSTSFERYMSQMRQIDSPVSLLRFLRAEQATFPRALTAYNNEMQDVEWVESERTFWQREANLERRGKLPLFKTTNLDEMKKIVYHGSDYYEPALAQFSNAVAILQGLVAIGKDITISSDFARALRKTFFREGELLLYKIMLTLQRCCYSIATNNYTDILKSKTFFAPYFPTFENRTAFSRNAPRGVVFWREMQGSANEADFEKPGWTSFSPFKLATGNPVNVPDFFPHPFDIGVLVRTSVLMQHLTTKNISCDWNIHVYNQNIPKIYLDHVIKFSAYTAALTETEKDRVRKLLESSSSFPVEIKKLTNVERFELMSNFPNKFPAATRFVRDVKTIHTFFRNPVDPVHYDFYINHFQIESIDEFTDFVAYFVSDKAQSVVVPGISFIITKDVYFSSIRSTLFAPTANIRRVNRFVAWLLCNLREEVFFQEENTQVEIKPIRPRVFSGSAMTEVVSWGKVATGRPVIVQESAPPPQKWNVGAIMADVATLPRSVEFFVALFPEKGKEPIYEVRLRHIFAAMAINTFPHQNIFFVGETYHDVQRIITLCDIHAHPKLIRVAVLANWGRCCTMNNVGVFEQIIDEYIETKIKSTPIYPLLRMLLLAGHHMTPQTENAEIWRIVGPDAVKHFEKN